MQMRKVHEERDEARETFFFARSPEAPKTDDERISREIKVRLRQGCTYDDGVVSESVATRFHGRDRPRTSALRGWRCRHWCGEEERDLMGEPGEYDQFDEISSLRQRTRPNLGSHTMADSDQAIKHFQDLVSPAYANADPTAIQVRASALLARLKALNRSANAATRTHKQATADARQDMDQTHLGLQNLLYEKRHLEREIDKCRQFAYAFLPFHVVALTLTRPCRSIYQDVPLHLLPEFQELAPPEARTPDVLENSHQLMLNRLSFELAERQRYPPRVPCPWWTGSSSPSSDSIFVAKNSWSKRKNSSSRARPSLQPWKASSSK